MSTKPKLAQCLGQGIGLAGPGTVPALVPGPVGLIGKSVAGIDGYHGMLENASMPVVVLLITES
jgi:hypothetical protein